MSNKLITAIIINGPHVGETMHTKYIPGLELPLKNNRESFVNGNTPLFSPQNKVVYKPTFISVDGEVALYSTSGNSNDFMEYFGDLLFYRTRKL